MTFGSAQFTDSGPTKARGAAARVRSRRTGNFRVEQGCHLADVLRKGAAAASGSAGFSGEPATEATCGRNFHY